MERNYELDTEDEKILDELDDLFGVVQNKSVLRDMITYCNLRKNGELNFGNYNIIIRNESDYPLLENFLKVCAKLFKKHQIISNENICYWDKLENSRRFDNFEERVQGIKESIIVINKDKMRKEFETQLEDWKKNISKYKKKIFVFEDTHWLEGELDAELGDLAYWRMTIESISLEDKIMYCQNRLKTNNISYADKDLKEYADCSFWILRNMMFKLILDCKRNKLDFVDRQMLLNNKKQFDSESGKNKSQNQRRKMKKIKDDKNANEELKELIGLDNIKMQMEKILNYAKINKEKGKRPTLHMCFTGNPGTGKTSVARIIGKMFEQEKILTGSGEFVEIHGRDLVDKYVGWTANKVHRTVERAIGNVLFIDEAYSLVANVRGSFEDEAIATLIKEMEDHREEICIILAGYTDEMKNLIELNPGFESRIQFTINFPDYNEEELFEIFKGLCKKEKYKLSNGCKEELIEHFKEAKKSEKFGNGRYVRNIFEKLKFEQADRIVKTDSKNMDIITMCDVKNVLDKIDLNVDRKLKRIGF